jgi:hypothetical protein
MSNNIELTSTTFSRLEQLAVGFDTPETVIIRLLDANEGKTDNKPELTFFPSDEIQFKRQLISSKEAEVVLYKHNYPREILHWNASRLSETSNLRGNLWSGMLRGWKKKGITKADLSVLPQGLNEPGDKTGQTKALALALQLTFNEMNRLKYALTESESNGVVQHYVVQFDESNDKDLLTKIEGLHEQLWVQVAPHIFADLS